MITLKSKREIGIIRENGKILAQTLELIERNIKEGIKTRKLDSLAEDFIRGRGALPAFKGYRGFPSSICVSVNEQVVHGIPDDRGLVSGDIISVDVGVYKDGYYADGAFTFKVGEVSPQAQRLIDVTRNSLYKGIEFCSEGKNLSDVSFAIQSHVEASGFQVVRELVGHGIGKEMHEEPQVPNFGQPGEGPVLREGMVLAIEPMVNMGSGEIETMEDGWTVVTKDRSLSAHFEHTVTITKNGPEILTRI
ncbi:MAG: methionine aminopeptidase [candidate division Zixibacteria bacterium SM23_73_2]|nr:MAG: methionine aminopeptidase [candidate division Zixibacteria bacterium SM23_73_2]